MFDSSRLPLLPMLLALGLTAACAPSQTPDEVPTESSTDEYTESMAHEHHDDAPRASDPDRPMSVEGVEGAALTYHQGEHGPVSGYLARPTEGEVLGGVVMIHEWWGLNDNIRAMANILASEGYAVLAVDLYEGPSAQTPTEARELMTNANARPEALAANLASAVAHLRDELNLDAIATLGWCFGGGQAFNTARALGNDVDAAVVYYGWVPTEPDAVAGITAPVLAIFAAEDQGIPMDLVLGFEAAMKSEGTPLDLHVFPGVDHAFANPSGNNYDPETAEAAWQLTLAFLKQHLTP